jgi:hypothetical protein
LANASLALLMVLATVLAAGAARVLLLSLPAVADGAGCLARAARMRARAAALPVDASRSEGKPPRLLAPTVGQPGSLEGLLCVRADASEPGRAARPTGAAAAGGEDGLRLGMEDTCGVGVRVQSA